MKPYAQPETGQSLPKAEPVNRPLEFLGDVRLSCSVVLGVCNITIRQLLSLAPGSVLELAANEGESLEFRANGNTVAKGEMVAVNDHYGIRITEVTDSEAGMPSRTK